MYGGNSRRGCLSFVCFFFLLFSVISAATAEDIPISGTVVTVTGETEEPIVGARVSALRADETIIGATAVCDDEGRFSLVVPDDIHMQFLVQGPEGSDLYVDTYSAFLLWKEAVIIWPDMPENLFLSIIPKNQAEAVIQALVALGYDEEELRSSGVIGGSVEANDPVAGVKLEVMLNDQPVPCEIVFFDENGDLDPSLDMTSSYGGFVIVNIPINTPPGYTEFSITATKEGYVFFFVPWVRVSPYQASPEKVTVVPIDGFKVDNDDEDEDIPPDGGGGCFISSFN